MLGVVLHFYAVFEIDGFYASHVPHYDSVGTLTYGVRILNAYQVGGWSSAFEFVARSKAATALSLTQAYFVAIFAPLLEPSPSSLQLYNSFATLCAMVAIANLALCLGLRGVIAGAACVVYLVPDGLWWWYFGLFDYRRDAGMLGFLTAAVCLMLAAFLTEAAGRRRMNAAVFGIFVGLSVLSRDSAAIYVMGLVGVPGAALVLWRLRPWGIVRAFEIPLLGFIAALPFLIVFALHFEALSSRLLDPLVAFGAGAPPLESLVGNADMILGVTLGLLPVSPFTKTHSLTPALLALIVVLPLLAAGIFKRKAPAREHADGRHPQGRLVLFLVGCWSIVFVYGLLTLFVGWKPSQGFLTRMPPFLPLLIGTTCFLLIPLTALTGARTRQSAVIAAAIVLATGAAIPARVAEGALEEPRWIWDANKAVAAIVARSPTRSLSFAELWFEAIRIPAVELYAVQRGGIPPIRTKFKIDDRVFDTAIGVPEDSNLRHRMLETMDRAIRCDADYIILTPDLSAYRNEAESLLIFREGETMARNLIRDIPQVAARVEVPSGQRPIEILDNRARSACPSGSPAG